MNHRRYNPVRSVAAGFLALVLLAPFLQGFVVAASPAGEGCCHNTTQCCHRLAHHKHSQGLQWTSATQCPKGCGLSAALPNVPGVRFVKYRFPHLPGSSESFLSNPPRSANRWSAVEFALFQRPPPLPV